MKKTRPQFMPHALFNKIHAVFKQTVPDKPGQYDITTSDCLMSGFAVFSLKYPSLLQFDHERQYEPTVRHNLTHLYGIERAPCDTYMRERLDGLPLSIIRSALAPVFHLLQRSKEMEKWKFLDKFYLLSLDGTGFFTSHKVHCDQCCEKVHKRGTKDEYTTYHHQMIVGSIVHPEMRQVLPIGFEPVERGDGSKKNDCERNSAKRWLGNFRQAHPQLPVVFLGDGLYSNAPFIRQVKKHRGKYILVARDDDHKALNDYFWAATSPDVTDFTDTSQGITRRYRFMEHVPLNDAHPDLLVTVIYYEEVNKKQETIKWTWVTDLEVTAQNVSRIVKGARTRFKIENETFNTIKNQGYNFEHNYGHGYKTLSNVFAGIMLLSFLIDQCLEAINVEFKAALKKWVSRIHLWQKIRSIFFHFRVSTWEKLYGAILDPPRLYL